jgi:hypothetical protein
VIPAVTQVPEELPTEMLLKVMDDWAKQWRQCTEVGGECLIY